MSYSRLTNDGGLSPLREDTIDREPRPIAHFSDSKRTCPRSKDWSISSGRREIRKSKERNCTIKRVNRPNGEREFGFGEEDGENGDDLVHEEQDHEYDYEGGEDEDDAESLAERHKSW